MYIGSNDSETKKKKAMVNCVFKITLTGSGLHLVLKTDSK